MQVTFGAHRAWKVVRGLDPRIHVFVLHRAGVDGWT
jgi:hypothetical protein